MAAVQQLWSEYASRLSYTDALTVVAGVALVMHQVVRKYEPREPPTMAAVILAPPTILTPLLALHHSLLPAFLVALLTYTAALSLSIAVYRLSPWHPLANVPGPFLARLSKFYMVSIATHGKCHLYYQSLHQRYGDFVRVGPNEVSIRLAAAVIPVLGANGLPKGPIWDGRSLGSARVEDRALISIRDPVEHGERRKLWNKGFSTAALKDYEEIIMKRGKQLVDILEESAKAGTPVDVAQLTGFFTFDFMGDMAFGGGFELMRDRGDTEGIWHIIEGGLRMTFLLSHVPWLTSWLRIYFSRSKKALPLRNFAGRMAKKRMSEGSLSRDLWHHLFEADNSIATLPFYRLIGESVLAIIAGSDTTSTVLSNAWFFLCAYPEYLARLQAEVEATFPNGEEPFDAIRLSQMPLLNAIINEAMRLQPATPSGQQRSVLPGTRGKAIGPRFIPEGTQVFIPTYTLHRDPRYFAPHPESFWPDRWLPAPERQHPAHLFGPASSPSDIASIADQADAAHILDTTAFIPFSFGPAACVGKNLALQEMRMMLSLVVQRFDMRFAEGYDEKRWFEDAEDWFVFKIGGLPVQLTART